MLLRATVQTYCEGSMKSGFGKVVHHRDLLQAASLKVGARVVTLSCEFFFCFSCSLRSTPSHSSLVPVIAKFPCQRAQNNCLRKLSCLRRRASVKENASCSLVAKCTCGSFCPFSAYGVNLILFQNMTNALEQVVGH